MGETICSEDDQGSKVNTTYNARGLASEILLNNGPNKVEMEYDMFGHRTEIIDPNAGTIASLYNVFGQLVEQTDANNKLTEYEYDALGRISTESLGTNTKTYTYDETFMGALSTISQSSPSNSMEYFYDEYGRLTSTTENFDGRTIDNEFTYDFLSRVLTSTYPDSSNLTIINGYNQYGYLASISALGKSLWECEDMNHLGMITEYNQGSSVNELTYDQYGYLQTQSYAGGERVFNYGFDDFMNLDYREDDTNGLKEDFFYDELNRLTSSDYYENDMLISENLSLEYDENGMGNIISKSGVGEKINYGEGTAGPNALTSIQNVETTYNPWPQTIGYTDFNKLSYMTDTITGGDSIQLSISYGFDNQRRKSTLTQPNAGDKTKYFFGDYEIITDDNGSKEYLFVNSPTGLCAIIENSNVSGTRKQKVWHTYTDHLGSLVYAVNADSTAEKREYSYDAWGNLRNHTDWLDDDPDYDLIADRGYTGHEHLTEFGLINMNGRVYDPVVGRFLSPDPFVQKPGFVDGYNRYSYVMNNPLRYVDPSGYLYEEEYLGTIYSPSDILPFQDGSGGSRGGGGYSYSPATSFSGIPSGAGIGVGGYTPGPTYQDFVLNNAVESFLWAYDVSSRINNAEKVEITENRIQFTNSPAPNNLIADMSLVGNDELGIYYHYSRSTGSLTVPYTSISITLGESFGDESSFSGGVRNQGGGDLVNNIVNGTGAAANIAEHFYNPNKGGNWVGKDFKIRSTDWGGNGATGGKFKFSGKVGTGLKIGGSVLGVYNTGIIYNQYTNGEINGAQLGIEQTSNAISTFGGIYGAAWGIGWELGATYGDRVPIPRYQRFKQNVVYPWRLKHLGY